MGEYVGAIRNSENKQVLFKGIEGPDSIIVIYDFDISVGDTIYTRDDDLIIHSIDSIQICGRYHKRYLGNGSKFVTEGVGYSNGLLGFFYYFDSNGEQIRFLDCYTEKDNPECPVCWNFLTAQPKSIKSSVYPVPTANIIRINSAKPITRIRIFDLTGKVVFAKTYHHIFQLEETADFLSPGIYLVETSFSDHTAETSRIVKN